MTFKPETPGLANLHTSGGPPNDTPVKFIRKDENGKMLVTRDGISVTHCAPDEISIKNPLTTRVP